MRVTYHQLLVLILIGTLCLSISVSAQDQQKDTSPDKQLSSTNQPMLWREPTDIQTRDLFYGPGGKDRQPQGKLTFIEEDMNGSNPKLIGDCSSMKQVTGVKRK